YGGTYAFMKNFLPRLGIQTRFINFKDLEAVEAAITPQTKVLYCETMSNPLLEVVDLIKVSALAKKKGIQLVVDNTFSPLSVAPARWGADVVIQDRKSVV